MGAACSHCCCDQRYCCEHRRGRSQKKKLYVESSSSDDDCYRKVEDGRLDLVSKETFLRPLHANPVSAQVGRQYRSNSECSGLSNCKNSNKTSCNICPPARFKRKSSSANRQPTKPSLAYSPVSAQLRRSSFTFHNTQVCTPDRPRSFGRNLSPPFPPVEAFSPGSHIGSKRNTEGKTERKDKNNLIYIKPRNGGKSAKIVSSNRQLNQDNTAPKNRTKTSLASQNKHGLLTGKF